MPISLDLYPDLVPFDLDRVAAHGPEVPLQTYEVCWVDIAWEEIFPRPHVVAVMVPGAFNRALPQIPLVQRTSAMRAVRIQGMDLAVEVDQQDASPLDLKGSHAVGRYLAEGCDLDKLAHRRSLPMILCRCRLGDTLANAREHLIPGGAFGHRPDLFSGPRHGGPTIPSALEEQHLNPFIIDLEFRDLSHRSLSCADFSNDRSHGGASERGFRPLGSQLTSLLILRHDEEA
jgi:hypothetical protein